MPAAAREGFLRRGCHRCEKRLQKCAIFTLKTIILPRQARDKHRETSRAEAFPRRPRRGWSQRHVRAGELQRPIRAVGCDGARRFLVRRSCGPDRAADRAAEGWAVQGEQACADHAVGQGPHQPR